MRCLLPLLAAGLFSLPVSVALAQADTKPRPQAPFPGPKGGDVERPDQGLPPRESPAQEPAPEPPLSSQPQPPEPEQPKPSGNEPPAPGPFESEPQQAPPQPGPRKASRLHSDPAPQLVELEDLFLRLREERRNVFSEKVQLELDVIELEGRLAPGPGRESLSSDLANEELDRLAGQLKSNEVRVLELGAGVDTLSRQLELLRIRLEEFQQMEELLQTPRRDP